MMKPDAPSAGLTPKQQRFVAEYLIDLNGTKAAIRAGYSARTANEQAVALLKHPGIAATIDAAKIARFERLDVDADYVLQRLFAEAQADLADLYTHAGDLKPVDEWPPIWRTGLVAGLDIEALYDGYGKDRVQIGVVKKLRLSDRLRRIELIGKHIRVNAFQDTVQHNGLDGLADRLARAKARIIAAGTEDTAVDIASVASATPSNTEQDQPRPEPVAREATPPPQAAPTPPPRIHRPIMPAAPWPDFSGPVQTDYDPLKD
ncbi:terminase small subunit [Tardiphaga sp. 813_E8_N1_3]|uniref:terminase small subunit n=1 Tax=Tardiphaga sp. 813_E8_N1_3 TaxID=3240760 RepID=UPI003F24F50C